ncbi:nucleoside-diphosphate kinase [bacterium]|nr:nucleoside-diphosphate kinase [bacterium]
MIQRTLLMIKPDAVTRKCAGDIISRIEHTEFRIVQLRMCVLSRNDAEKFYAVHRGQDFFEPLVDFMISGPCIPMVVEGPEVIQAVRAMVGATDSKQAAEGTIRKDFGTDGRRNAVHASDSEETATREIGFFFE